MKSYDYIVIGNGLIGSAATRYLSKKSKKVALIGPSEPENQQTHQGVFSSHYDQGRLTRQLSQDPIWSEIAWQAVQNYAYLEKASGIQFHGAVGRAYATQYSDEARQELLAWIAAAKDKHGIEYQYFASDDRSWQELFPYLDFPEGFEFFYEPPPAGYVNPRSMRQAQNVISQQQGVTVFDELVTQVKSTAVHVKISTAEGNSYTADKVLIACGAFTNFNNLLPEAIPLRLKTESMVWGDVAEETAVQLQTMPALGYNIKDSSIDDVYIAPPIRYPDGSYKIKLGCNSPGELWPETLEEVQAWFRQGNSKADLPPMSAALKSVLPEVQFTNMSSHRCIVTYTPSGYPTIDQVPSDDHGRLFIAAGGNGTGAQGSDTLGRLAAGFMENGRWLDKIPRQPFLATNHWGISNNHKSKAQTRALNKSAT